MPCYHPITAYRSRSGRNKETGNWPIVFNRNEGYQDLTVEIPCGRCIGCRLEHSKQWATRCMLEAQQQDKNSFITLTFNNENHPEDGSLQKSDLQKFFKRLRKQHNIRYFACGEYGEQFRRPHYHACIFGYDWPDRELVEGGLYESKELSSLWPYGYHKIGDFSWETAAYVARYVTKKISGDQAQIHYDDRVPEFALMSRKPGLGREWYNEFKGDVIGPDQIIIRNSLRVRPPRYYDNIMLAQDKEGYLQLKAQRAANVRKEENTPDRLATRELVQKLKSEEFQKRKIENGNAYVCNS